MSEVKTLEEFRERKQSRLPIFLVQFLPYTEFFDKYKKYEKYRYKHGSLEDVYTTREEAERRFRSLCRCGLVEKAELREVVPEAGMPVRREWKDSDVLLKNSPGRQHLDNLPFLQEEYRLLARQEGRLTKEEFRRKQELERRIQVLDNYKFRRR